MNDFLKRFRALQDECFDITRKKNSDYADENEPYKNFMASQHFGVSPPQAILVRLSDKLTRAGNLLKRDAQVTDEKIEDTLKDASNYCLLLLMLIEHMRVK